MNNNLLELERKLKGKSNISVLRDEPLSRHTTFKIGGAAELFIHAGNADAAVQVLDTIRSMDLKPLVIGNGSNLLVSDNGVKGVVVKICGGNCICEGDSITADAGASLVALSRCALKESLTGMEFLYGIPGTVGGAVVMNAGAYGGELSQILVETTYYSPEGEVRKLDLAGHEFGYRMSRFKKEPEAVVLSSKFKLNKANSNDIRATMDELMQRRKDKQPLEYPSAGSVFKRPVGHFAGALIENCGLKGYQIGGARVSEKHAGFIVNTGGATCSDVKKLIEYIKNTVLKETGVELECEICFVGDK